MHLNRVKWHKRISSLPDPFYFRGTTQAKSEKQWGKGHYTPAGKDGYAHKQTPRDKKNLESFLHGLDGQLNIALSEAVRHGSLKDPFRFKPLQEISREMLPEVTVFISPESEKRELKFGVMFPQQNEIKMSELDHAGLVKKLFSVKLTPKDYQTAMEKAKPLIRAQKGLSAEKKGTIEHFELLRILRRKIVRALDAFAKQSTN